MKMKAKGSITFIYTVLAVAIFAIGAACYFWGDKHALDTMRPERVTPTRLAEAMKGDHFFSDYRERTLVVAGTVSAVQKHGQDTRVALETSSSYSLWCDLGTVQTAPRVHDMITVIAQGSTAARQTSGVLLTHCLVP